MASRGRGGRSLTLTVVAEGHLGLAETNGVLAGADAIELLELGLLDILELCFVVSRRSWARSRDAELEPATKKG